ncbi:MAG: VWA domain-containing protein, partial [Armatimonadetes bacterium]|nr:VWA domain-containing protein [Armatimonadota bacterium]
GFHEIGVLLESEGQQCLENDRAAGFVRVKGEPRLLLLDSDPEDARLLAERLETQDVVVEAAGPVGIPTNVADLERYDAVYLSNLPAYAMDDSQMRLLRDATRDRGIGLGMIGGDRSFGAGGYYRTPVEEALPVDMDVTKNRVYPGSAVLMVMDTSGSMGAIEDGKEKIELAAEAACAVVDLLAPHDSAGLIASDPRPTSICELRKLTNKDLVKRDIRSVRAGGGGIACYPSLSAAYDVLQHNDASIRHIILLADGSDCDEQNGCVPLVAAMAKEKITTTAVAFGAGPHVPFLQEVARVGGGDFYLTEVARDLKKIFTRETLTVAKSVLVEEPFRAALNDSTAPVSGLDWSGAPPLLGYVASTPKSLARVPLLSHKQDPLLAHWQYGLGKSVAFTSDAKNHWAAHWLGWPGYSQFWGQTVRWSLRDLGSDVLYLRTELQGDTARVVVDAVAPNGSLLNGLTIRGVVGGPGGRREEVVFSQTAPGRYEGVVEAPDQGAYVTGLQATGPGGFEARQTSGFEVGYPPDFAETKPQESFLRAMATQTGGRLLADPEEVFTALAEMPRVPQDIWRLLLWLAAILLPFDVAVRRLVIRREDLAAFTTPVKTVFQRARARRAQEEVAREERLGRLLQAKQEARKRAAEETPTASVMEGDEGVTPLSPTAVPQVEREPRAPDTSGAEKAEPGDTTSRLLDRKRRRRGEKE